MIILISYLFGFNSFGIIPDVRECETLIPGGHESVGRGEGRINGRRGAQHDPDDRSEDLALLRPQTIIVNNIICAHT